MSAGDRTAATALLRWYVDMGADEALAPDPLNRLAANSPPQEQVPGEPAATVAGQSVPATTLEELRAEVESFRGCALRTDATRTVFSDGNPEAGLMLIGEAPGREEDRIGLPFVGSAGKLLDQMLAAIGRDRTSAYITNVVFWRPPNNRTPTDEEMATCLPFVRTHVALVRPQAILLLGAAAARVLLGTRLGISKLRGQWRELPIEGIPPVPALPTFHPAFLLRQPARKADVWEDLRNLKRRLDGP